MMIDKSNGKNHFKCIILKRGFIPILNCMGPITNPRLLDEDIIRLLIKLGLDIRVVDQNVDDAMKIDLIKLDNIINNKHQFVKEEVKPVVKEEVKPVVKEEVKPVKEEVKPVVKEEVKPKNNKQNKNKK